ncbi:porin [Variovorax sp. Sphag1AA]|uniref:porin n=1 Tax=Variovorax sp. Sphag1AA TaxID=2587027 RepID=UPI00161E9A3F|nr:porin [Variovorax sp. Sphag1AA]MBB3179096.1 putative porin [Variovorax sp. Sphag1AA]
MRRVTLATFAVGALSAAGMASAQTSAVQSFSGGSSVTLFGIADVTYGYGSGSIASKSQLYSGGNTASRLGFRGVEDLGGGMAAGFWLEAGLNIDDGSTGTTNTNNQSNGSVGGFNFNRRATVSLMDFWGEVRAGRDFTAHYRNRTDVDPFSNNGVGTSQPQAGSIGGPTSTRASNIVAYYLPPNLGGFFGEVEYYYGENGSPSPIEDDGNGYSGRVGYANGPFAIALAAGRTKFARTTTNGDIDSANLGVSWDFKVVKVMGGYYRDKVDKVGELTGTGYLVGAIVPIGFDQIKVSWSTYGTDAVSDPTARKWAFGYVYNFSKRTAVYATYARVNNSGGSTAAVNGSITDANRNSSGYDLGMKLSF